MEHTKSRLLNFIALSFASLTLFSTPVLANILSRDLSQNTIYLNLIKTRPTLLAVVASTTPEGSVAITKGPLIAQVPPIKTVQYGDPRGKHTRLAGYTQAQLEQAAKSPDPKKKQEQLLVDAIKAQDTANYGSQLNSVAVGKYAELVKDAVEKGIPKPRRSDMYFYEASFVVGVDVATGKGTKRYRVDSVPNGTHVIPVEYTDKDLK
jgi:hypothetical protein